MKAKLILILISLIYACSTTTKEKTISIIDNWDSRAQDNIESHKDKEVEISRMHMRDKEGKFEAFKMTGNGSRLQLSKE